MENGSSVWLRVRGHSINNNAPKMGSQRTNCPVWQQRDRVGTFTVVQWSSFFLSVWTIHLSFTRLTGMILSLRDTGWPQENSSWTHHSWLLLVPTRSNQFVCGHMTWNVYNSDHMTTACTPRMWHSLSAAFTEDRSRFGKEGRWGGRSQDPNWKDQQTNRRWKKGLERE